MAAAALSMSGGACRPVTDFAKGDKLGEGTYGSVYTATDKTSGRRVALKRVKLSAAATEREGMPLTSLREIALLRRLRHCNIVSFIEVAVGSRADSVFLVFEYCAHDLAQLIDTMQAPFAHGEVKWMLAELLSAVEHVHANMILHRDLKMSNLLLTSDGTLKLCDFGLARVRAACEAGNAESRDGDGEAYTPRVVTLWYRAPELLLGATLYGPAVDMWSVGCILGELLLHRPLLPASSEIAQLEAICQLIGTPSPRIWPGVQLLPSWATLALPEQPYNDLADRFSKVRPGGAAIDLLNALLTYDPRKRVTAQSAASHAYVSSVSALPRPERPTSHAARRQSSSWARAHQPSSAVAASTSGAGGKRPAPRGAAATRDASSARPAQVARVRLPSPADVTVAGGRLC